MVLKHDDIHAILRAYFKPPIDVLKCKKIGVGYIHSTYELSIDRGLFILQQFNSGVFPNIASVNQNINSLADHLTTHNYPRQIISVLPTRTQSTYFKKNEHHYRLLNFIPHAICYDHIPNTEIAYNASAAFGEWHVYTSTYPTAKLQPVLPDFINFKYRIQLLKQAVVQSDTYKLKKSRKLLHTIESNIKLLTAFTQAIDQQSLTTKVIHADPKISNVLFHKSSSEVAAIIDLDTIIPGPILIDFGEMIRSYTNPSAEDDPNNINVFSTDIHAAVMDGFLQYVGHLLTPTDKIWLPEVGKVITLIQSMRFLTDYLDGNIYYPVSHPDQNLDRTHNQINVFKSMLTVPK